MKWMIAFDLDGTLAESKRPLSEDMAATLARLLAVTDVAVISGGDWPQFEKQVASRLPAGAALDRLWLMPTTGTKLYRFINGAWRAVYAELFDDAEKATIRAAFDQRSEEHTSELQSLMRISYAVFCLKKKKIKQITTISVTDNTTTNERTN